MRKFWIAASLVAGLTAGSLVAGSVNNKGITKLYHPGETAPPAGNITYYGGPVMLGTPRAYVVYYGKWATAGKNLVNTFLSNLGGSGAYNVNTTYFDKTKTHLTNALSFSPTVNTYTDNYSMGKSITDAQTQAIISKAISGGHLPVDDNGVYFVLTSPDVKQFGLGSQFCVLYCGYHSPSTTIVSGHVIKYSFVGNASTQCPSGCIGNNAIYGETNSPNGKPGIDGLISVMFHELSESVTDPEVNLNTAWNGGSCGENGDCCNFNFGTTFIAPNGTHANVTLGGLNFLIQTMFKLQGTTVGTDPGVCVNHLP